MPIVTNFELVVTDTDRELAREAMVEGWNNCKQTNNFQRGAPPCDCSLGAIDGCKARVEAVARVIAAARRM